MSIIKWKMLKQMKLFLGKLYIGNIGSLNPAQVYYMPCCLCPQLRQFFRMSNKSSDRLSLCKNQTLCQVFLGSSDIFGSGGQPLICGWAKKTPAGLHICPFKRKALLGTDLWKALLSRGSQLQQSTILLTHNTQRGSRLIGN